jgi:hypothetical protein
MVATAVDERTFEALQERARTLQADLALLGASTALRVRWAVRERLRFGGEVDDVGGSRGFANRVLDVLARSGLSAEQERELERIIFEERTSASWLA